MSKTLTTRPGGTVAAVRTGSIAADLAWQPGDRLVSLNGHVLRDVIDYRFYQADDQVEAVVDHGSHVRTYVIRKDPDEDLGVEFSDGLFDRLRTCRNDCPFCFLKGLPQGLRRTLYLKDDDYRYSFLFGNFITLTNLSEEDWRRLAEQRLSPLYVSVHATDLSTRRRLLGNPSAPDVVEQIRRLGRMGIRVHTQVVLVPPVNTGEVLGRTVADLAALYPTVQSIGIVPVGLTRVNSELRSLTAAEAMEVVSAHRSWRLAFRRTLPVSLVYLGDELFLRSGTPVPGARYYEGFPQLENGIGLVRSMLDDWSRVKRRVRWSSLPSSPISLVCGTLAAPILARVAGEWNAVAPGPCRVVAVRNRLFGETVTVSGLLAAQDVVAALSEKEGEGTVFLPQAMFDASGRVTLDDATLEDLEKAVSRPMRVGATMRDVVEALLRGS
jgi:putative radical SAM enzyme (TIGR03279 family)